MLNIQKEVKETMSKPHAATSKKRDTWRKLMTKPGVKVLSKARRSPR